MLGAIATLLDFAILAVVLRGGYVIARSIVRKLRSKS